RTRRQSRQLVNHGHITVDGKRVDIPSYSVKPGQVIGIREQARNMDVIKEALEVNNFTPDYLTVDPEKMEATFTRTQERSELPAHKNTQKYQQKLTKHLSLSSIQENNFSIKCLYNNCYKGIF